MFEQENYLEDILREGYSHPAVQGIVIWPMSPFSRDCYMCLTDQNFKNTPNGDIVDKLTKLWRSEPLELSAEVQGFSEALLLHGNYEVVVRHPDTSSSINLTLTVSEKSPDFFQVKFSATANVYL
ncbi:hypothetical protein vseg_007777 [Gypsophila vaccaria]